MKEAWCTMVGIVGSLVTTVFGGWSTAMTALVIFMAIDYISGVIVAGVFNKSTKTNSGSLSSIVGIKGLFRKGGMLAIVLIAHYLDLVMGSNFIKDAVVIAFIANETISIIENMGLMGVPIPKVIIKAIDVLKEQTDGFDEEERGENNGN